MPNGGSDCCGACWHNRSNRGERGSRNHDSAIPSHCEIRDLDIPDPFYTYCANHPYHRPGRDTIPIGPVYVHESDQTYDSDTRVWQEHSERVRWQPSPDTEDIRQHLLDLIRSPAQHSDEGYHWYAQPAYSEAMRQLIEWRDERVIDALTELSKRPEIAAARPDIEEAIKLASQQLRA